MQSSQPWGGCFFWGYRRAWLNFYQLIAMPKSKRIDKFQLVADNLLSLMASGNIPWRKPWSVVPTCNAITEHQYGGINPLLAQVDVMAKGYQYPLFAGLNKLRKKAGSFRRAAKPLGCAGVVSSVRKRKTR